jgi:hypothetical protein
MDKTLAGLVGAVATLTTMNARAAPPQSDPGRVLRVRSYAELLEPVPNALAVLKADDAARNEARTTLQKTQYYYHHHHHHHGFYGYGFYPPCRFGYHHHHHHHHGYYRDY